MFQMQHYPIYHSYLKDSFHYLTSLKFQRTSLVWFVILFWTSTVSLQSFYFMNSFTWLVGGDDMHWRMIYNQASSYVGYSEKKGAKFSHYKNSSLFKFLIYQAIF